MQTQRPPDDPQDELYTYGLLQRMHAGDAAATELLFQVHRERLRRALRAHLAPESRALIDREDVLQETVLRALRRIERFEWRGKGAFLAWLVRIALNVLCDETKRAARFRPEPFAREAQGDADEPANHLEPTDERD